MWGIIPAAGSGTRIQPLAFSKELLPVGSRHDGVVERPKAVSEYLVDRLVLGGARKVCFVISPNKSDIMRYYGSRLGEADFAYVVQREPAGLCDAVFTAAPLIGPDEPVALGLPDTIWFPEDALRALPDDRLSFLLFPVDQPQHFDVVVTDDHGRVQEVQVKSAEPRSKWIWGPSRCPAACSTSFMRSGRRKAAVTNTSAPWSMRGWPAAARRWACAPARAMSMWAR